MYYSSVGKEIGIRQGDKVLAVHSDAMHPYDLGGACPRFMIDDEDETRLETAYSENYARSAIVKKEI
jgi:hypothetical protein